MDYDTLYLGAMAGASAVILPFLINQIKGGFQVALRARYALQRISLGDDSRKYHNDIQDAKIDGLAGLLIGGRRALFRAVREGSNSAR